MLRFSIIKGNKNDKRGKGRLLKEPDRVLEQLIKNFINEGQQNRRTQLDHGNYWKNLWWVCLWIDPLFLEYKTLIGPFHLSPREVISAALKERGRPLLSPKLNRSASFHGPFPLRKTSERVIARKNNSHLNSGPTPETLGGLQYRLKKHLITFLEDLGHIAVAPPLSPTFQYIRDEKIGWASPWSERHVAYACGLGLSALMMVSSLQKGWRCDLEVS